MIEIVESSTTGRALARPLGATLGFHRHGLASRLGGGTSVFSGLLIAMGTERCQKQFASVPWLIFRGFGANRCLRERTPAPSVRAALRDRHEAGMPETTE